MKSLRFPALASVLCLLILGGCATDPGASTPTAGQVSSDELARAAQIPGTLVLDSSPSGATVVVGDRPPVTTPSRLLNLRAGTYPVQIAYPGYESETRQAEIKPALVTDLGTVTLKRVVGTVAIVSSPAQLVYEIKATSGAAAALDPRTGRTPATLNDLSPGSYEVKVIYPGRTAVTQTVTVVRNETATVEAKWPEFELYTTRTGGVVKLTWAFPPNEYRGLEVMRNVQEKPSGRNRLGSARATVNTYEDKVPDPAARYWYWVKGTTVSGKAFNVGPVEAVAK